ncbi:MAG: (Fe-S)-binding protein [Saprospiraceae bacterium]
MVQQIVFILLAAVTFFFAYKQYAKIVRNIRFGKSEEIEGSTAKRWKNVALIAFGQKKMFKRWIPAIMHLFIYVAFLFTQIELVEIILDGVFGFHRFFADKLGVVYNLMINSIEFLSVGAFVATIVFLARRNLLKLPRFTMSEMKGWPFKDANLILLGELFLLLGIFSMNGADVVLQNIDSEHFKSTGHLMVSSHLGPALFGSLSESTLHIVERFGWWLHIIAVFGFINYLPYSKHLHIFLAFPNVYYSNLKPRGEMSNMTEIMNEVKSMMGLVEDTGEEMSDDIPEFGSKDVFDLSWKNILGAYTCTECGRCSSVCPANITGKKLSPRKIMMDIRDRADEIGQNIDSGKEEFKRDNTLPLSPTNYEDGKSLFDNISKEEIYACTTCNACVEACPVLINPLEPILEMRRYEILTKSEGPSDWLPMFNSLENGGAVWQMPEARDQWSQDFNLKND